MIMAAFSYLTAISTEENRTFRFAVFQVVITTIPIIGNLLAPTLIKNFDYAQLFGMVIPIHIFGLVYFLRLKEPKQHQDEQKQGHDNLAMDEMSQYEARGSVKSTPVEMLQSTTNIVESETAESSKNFCMEFFDLKYAKQCIAILFKTRENVMKSLLISLLLAHFLLISVPVGENIINFSFQRKVLNWDADYYSYNAAFGITTSMVGTVLFVGLLGKVLKVPDIFQAFVSVVFSMISRGIFISIHTTIGYVFGTFIDFAASVKLLVTRSLISKVVQDDEIATTYSLMGVLEALATFVFAYVYPTLYIKYVEVNPNINYILSIGIMVLVLVVYW